MRDHIQRVLLVRRVHLVQQMKRESQSFCTQIRRAGNRERTIATFRKDTNTTIKNIDNNSSAPARRVVESVIPLKLNSRCQSRQMPRHSLLYINLRIIDGSGHNISKFKGVHVRSGSHKRPTQAEASLFEGSVVF